MFDHEVPFRTLIDDCKQQDVTLEAYKIRDRTKVILKDTQAYVPFLNDESEDEFLSHMSDLRREATTLHEECDKFIHSTGLNVDVRDAIQTQWSSLCGLVELLCVLKVPNLVEEVHAAL